MTQSTDPKRPPCMRVLAAALLTTTILGGVAGHAWSQIAPSGNAPQPAPVQAVPSATAAGQPMAAPPAVVAPSRVQQLGFASLVNQVKGAVVNISTTERVSGSRQSMRLPDNLPPGMEEMLRRYFGNRGGGSGDNENRTRRSAGSGFIIDPAGWIVTNNHVVEGATKITVTLSDGSIHPATVKGTDDKVDLAIIKIDTDKQLPSVAFGNSDQSEVGDWVIAVGNPFGLGGSVTAGIISAHGRDLHAGPYDDFLQIDAPINPGNSGGPLFNQQGQVIGVSTAIYSPSGGSVGIGFAIPSNLVARVISELREHGTVQRGWLGVQMQPLTPDLARAMGRPNVQGVLINRVDEDSPAARAKLQQGDVITSFGERQIKTPRDLAVAVGDMRPGTSAQMKVWREGRERTLTVTIGQPKPAEKQAQANTEGSEPQTAGTDRVPVGLSLAPLQSEQRRQLNVPASTKGVVVVRVAPASRAAESGLEPGDIIVRIGDDAVTSPNDAIAKIKQAEAAKKEAVPLLVMREGATYYLALRLSQS
jgi:serine protease Do